MKKLYNFEIKFCGCYIPENHFKMFKSNVGTIYYYVKCPRCKRDVYRFK